MRRPPAVNHKGSAGSARDAHAVFDRDRVDRRTAWKALDTLPPSSEQPLRSKGNPHERRRGYSTTYGRRPRMHRPPAVNHKGSAGSARDAHGSQSWTVIASIAAHGLWTALDTLPPSSEQPLKSKDDPRERRRG